MLLVKKHHAAKRTCQDVRKNNLSHSTTTREASEEACAIYRAGLSASIAHEQPVDARAKLDLGRVRGLANATAFFNASSLREESVYVSLPALGPVVYLQAAALQKHSFETEPGHGLTSFATILHHTTMAFTKFTRKTLNPG